MRIPLLTVKECSLYAQSVKDIIRIIHHSDYIEKQSLLKQTALNWYRILQTTWGYPLSDPMAFDGFQHRFDDLYIKM